MPLSEKEKMLAGELYCSSDPELQAAAAQAQQHLRRLNSTPNEDLGLRRMVLQALLGSLGDFAQIKSPFSCDYGWNIHIGHRGFINYGCVFLDCSSIRIGDDAQIGPGVHIYTALHPLDGPTRQKGLEAAKPVTIGHNVWLGGSCVICPGVSIGDNTVVGAGGVVVRNLPPNVLAVGNPCRVIRRLS
jgi:maltose O-acetyltransferase